MKKILLLLSCLFGSAIAVQAQSFANNDKGVFLRAELRALARSKSDGVAQRGMDVEAIVGYRFDGRFSLFIPVTATTGLFKAGGVKSYEQAGQLGLGFGYAPLHTTRDRLEIAVRAGNTLGGSWHFRYYDLGVRWEWADLKIPPFVGLGVRYQDCYKGGFSDYCFFLCHGRIFDSLASDERQVTRLSPGSLPGDFFFGASRSWAQWWKSRVNDKLSRRLLSPNAGRMDCIMCVFNKCVKDNKS